MYSTFPLFVLMNLSMVCLKVHEAYIEAADLVVKTDPLAAVEIYSQFPVPDPPSFDDAYIIGELVRLLMKAEKFDDPRLGPNLIAQGRVLGIGKLGCPTK